MKSLRILIPTICLMGLIPVVPLAARAQQTISIENAEAVISIDVYPARGNLLFIWLPPEGGFQSIHSKTAQRLAVQDIEVWLVDLLINRL